MKHTILFLLCAITLGACDNANEQHPSTQYEQKKASLKDIETGSPLKFLKVSGDLHNNLINQTVVSGEVVNNATLVSYKDVELLLIFKDEDNKVIEKQKQTLDDVMKPGSTTDFKLKLSHVKGASSVVVDISSAVATK
jgi:hypothetical protein